MKKIIVLLLAVAALLALMSCESFISTVKQRDIVNNTSYAVKFALQDYSDDFFAIGPNETMTKMLPSFPVGRIVSDDAPVMFKTHSSYASIEELPAYTVSVRNVSSVEVAVAVKNDRFCSPRSQAVEKATCTQNSSGSYDRTYGEKSFTMRSRPELGDFDVAGAQGLGRDLRADGDAFVLWIYETPSDIK